MPETGWSLTHPPPAATAARLLSEPRIEDGEEHRARSIPSLDYAGHTVYTRFRRSISRPADTSRKRAHSMHRDSEVGRAMGKPDTLTGCTRWNRVRTEHAGVSTRIQHCDSDGCPSIPGAGRGFDVGTG